MFKHLLSASCAIVILFNGANAFAQISARDVKPVPDAFLSAGDNDGFRGWARAIAGSAKQGVRDGIAGYDASSAGFALGADTSLKSCPAVVGASLSYVNTDVTNSGVSATEVDSYKFGLYGDYDFGGGIFARGSLGLGHDNNDASRFNAGFPGVTAVGDYDATQFDTTLELMRYFQLGYATVTPNLSARYIHYAPDSYNETGAGLANLHVDQADMDVLELGAGFSAAWVFDGNDGSGAGFSPGFHADVSYDTIGDRISTNTSPVGGGPVANTQGPSVARTRLNAGANIVWFNGEGWDFKLAYDFDMKSDYFAQAGTVRVTGQF